MLVVGLSALFLGLAIAGATLVFATAGKTGVARALADIDRVYARHAAAARGAGVSFGDRVMRPVVLSLTTLGRVLTPAAAQSWMRRWLGYAGNPPAWPPARILEAQGLGLVGFGFLGVVLGLVLWLTTGTLLAVVLCGLFGALFGLSLPYIVVSHIGQKRQQEIQLLLPDALDMLTLCVEAGLPFDQAMVQVAQGTRGPLAREVARALHEMQMGKARAEAMRALADRTSVAELRMIASAVVQATELGIPIADVLRERSREMRARRRQRAEEAARKVPVKILFPLIFCLFPALFVVILGPGVLRIMDTLAR